MVRLAQPQGHTTPHDYDADRPRTQETRPPTPPPLNAAASGRVRYYAADGKLIEYRETSMPAGRHYSRANAITGN